MLTDSPETAIFNLDATTASSSASQSDLTDQITPNQWSRVMWPFHAIGETTVYFNLWKNSVRPVSFGVGGDADAWSLARIVAHRQLLGEPRRVQLLLTSSHNASSSS